MNTLSKKLTIKEKIIENKIRSAISLSVLVMAMIFIYQVVKRSPYMSIELTLLLVGIGFWVIILTISTLLSPKETHIEQYLFRKESYEIRVDYLQN